MEVSAKISTKVSAKVSTKVSTKVGAKISTKFFTNAYGAHATRQATTDQGTSPRPRGPTATAATPRQPNVNRCEQARLPPPKAGAQEDAPQGAGPASTVFARTPLAKARQAPKPEVRVQHLNRKPLTPRSEGERLHTVCAVPSGVKVPFKKTMKTEKSCNDPGQLETQTGTPSLKTFKKRPLHPHTSPGTWDYETPHRMCPDPQRHLSPGHPQVETRTVAPDLWLELQMLRCPGHADV
ncbi:hypothetical protein E5288_WYG005143 [Bos mutus]|uniref:Uncharacterized protein n=1 Tax=Bos mutus TaxID=72004 RepID=A0A6B0S1H4_9CETA|nr:hypothetical protein [Bos mutus]